MKAEKNLKSKIINLSSIVLSIILISSCSEIKDFTNNPALHDTNEIDKPGTITHLQSAKAEINGESGGTLSIEKNYINPYGENANVSVTLVVPVGAYLGTKNISMTTNDKDLSITFSPKSDFAIPLKLSLSFTE